MKNKAKWGTKPSVFSRLILALATCRRILVDVRFAGQIAALRAGSSTTAPDAPGPEVPRLQVAEPNAGLQLLGLLQQEGRFIDFLEEDVGTYSDAEIGAAARVVHEGCKKTLGQHFTIEAVRAEAEGTRVTLAEGFDASAVQLTGNVVGQAPFTGSLVHRGWQVTETRLPQVAAGHDLTILAPAEVEL
ncbi:DUF2760 domain-containing protein [Candidatus Thiosymbion oneisti]|uniref:DUF2760 domain-containing protein n=1 Tax=Candidatus Thiosymbion oneisti TaxID=589554 RepID=UPI00105DD180|nr:DUF2760 domain-containing protein [Candidatus Thiosymbion oneisti]